MFNWNYAVLTCFNLPIFHLHLQLLTCWQTKENTISLTVTAWMVNWLVKLLSTLTEPSKFFFTTTLIHLITRSCKQGVFFVPTVRALSNISTYTQTPMDASGTTGCSSWEATWSISWATAAPIEWYVFSPITNFGSVTFSQ